MKKLLLAASALAFATPAWASDQPTEPSAENGQGSVIATGAASSAAAQGTPAPMTAEERDMLLQEIRGLRDRVTALETKSTQVQYSPDMPQRHKLLGDHNLELYGFLQL